jgi:hypothetical protein
MTSSKTISGLCIVGIVLLMNFNASAQVVVNDKNLNEDKDLKYIQLMYFIDKATLRPVFYVDYGIIEPEYNEILRPDKDFTLQKISINGEEVSDRVTAVWVLNKMYKAGWEYLGDVVYVPIPMMDKWTIFTMKRI